MIPISKPEVGQSVIFDAWITASAEAQAKAEYSDLSVIFDSLLSDITVWEITSVSAQFRAVFRTTEGGNPHDEYRV